MLQYRACLTNPRPTSGQLQLPTPRKAAGAHVRPTCFCPQSSDGTELIVLRLCHGSPTTPQAWLPWGSRHAQHAADCPGQLPGPPPEFNTCLGDLYSVSWLEDSDVRSALSSISPPDARPADHQLPTNDAPCSDLTTETLETQFERVKWRTSNNKTYTQGSHVLQFGTRAIDEEPAADFLGFLNTGLCTGHAPNTMLLRCVRLQVSTRPSVSRS